MLHILDRRLAGTASAYTSSRSGAPSGAAAQGKTTEPCPPLCNDLTATFKILASHVWLGLASADQPERVWFSN
eukprot:8961-Heterococcus_DN1.PRE.3